MQRVDGNWENQLPVKKKPQNRTIIAEIIGEQKSISIDG